MFTADYFFRSPTGSLEVDALIAYHLEWDGEAPHIVVEAACIEQRDGPDLALAMSPYALDRMLGREIVAAAEADRDWQAERLAAHGWHYHGHPNDPSGLTGWRQSEAA